MQFVTIPQNLAFTHLPVTHTSVLTLLVLMGSVFTLLNRVLPLPSVTSYLYVTRLTEILGHVLTLTTVLLPLTLATTLFAMPTEPYLSVKMFQL